jgi:predicted RNA-binding protein (TIGR00451 family)
LNPLAKLHRGKVSIKFDQQSVTVLCVCCCPADMMPKLRTDKGAIKFVLSGANIMCPGLTSPGATIHTEVRRTWSGDERGTGNAVTERHCWRDAN